ncbi:hypothetical protein QUA56_25445 [Microcoleus sp. N3A4]
MQQQPPGASLSKILNSERQSPSDAPVHTVFQETKPTLIIVAFWRRELV